MSKTNPIQPVARQQMKPLTEEEQRELYIRSYVQKKTAVAEGVLYNMVRGNMVSDAKGLVKIVDEISTEFMKVICHQEIMIKDEEEK